MEYEKKRDSTLIARKKIEETMRKSTLINLQLCTKLRAIHGQVYLMALLKRIELEKAEFVYQIEEGEQVFIPRDLSQDELPQSFRYYDPIMAIV